MGLIDNEKEEAFSLLGGCQYEERERQASGLRIFSHQLLNHSMRTGSDFARRTSNEESSQETRMMIADVMREAIVHERKL